MDKLEKAIIIGILISLAVELIADPIKNTLDDFSSYAVFLLGLIILIVSLLWYRRAKG